MFGSNRQQKYDEHLRWLSSKKMSIRIQIIFCTLFAPCIIEIMNIARYSRIIDNVN
jgi:hypothetical protein